MRQSLKIIAAAGAFTIAIPPVAMGEPLENMDAVGTAIMDCWKAPSGSENSFVTLSFSFRRDGTLIGRPRPTGSHVPGDEEERKKFIDAAVAALEDCTPLEFSPALAEGIPGKVFTMRFGAAKEQAADTRPK